MVIALGVDREAEELKQGEFLHVAKILAAKAFPKTLIQFQSANNFQIAQISKQKPSHLLFPTPLPSPFNCSRL